MAIITRFGGSGGGTPVVDPYPHVWECTVVQSGTTGVVSGVVTLEAYDILHYTMPLGFSTYDLMIGGVTYHTSFRNEGEMYIQWTGSDFVVVSANAACALSHVWPNPTYTISGSVLEITGGVDDLRTNDIIIFNLSSGETASIIEYNSVNYTLDSTINDTQTYYAKFDGTGFEVLINVPQGNPYPQVAHFYKLFDDTSLSYSQNQYWRNANPQLPIQNGSVTLSGGVATSNVSGTYQGYLRCDDNISINDYVMVCALINCTATSTGAYSVVEFVDPNSPTTRYDEMNLSISSGTISAPYQLVTKNFNRSNAKFQIRANLENTSNIKYVTFAQHDDITTLATKCGSSATTISGLIADSALLLSVQDAVYYMVAQCTGDFMLSACADSTFLNTLLSSPYASIVMDNAYWSEFITAFNS